MQKKHTQSVPHVQSAGSHHINAAGAKYYTGITDEKRLHQKLLMVPKQKHQAVCMQKLLRLTSDTPLRVSLFLIQVWIHQGN